jgi:hypothetical protein
MHVKVLKFHTYDNDNESLTFATSDSLTIWPV